MADGRIYTVEFENVAVTTAVDMWELTAADDKPIEIVGLFITQNTEVASNVGEDEFIRFRIVRGNTTSGSGGGTATPVPVDPSDAAAGFTAETNNTTAASAGTAVNLLSDNFNLRVGYREWYPAGCGLRTVQASLLVVRFLAAPADSVSFTSTVFVREA